MNRPVLILCVLVFGNALYQVESILRTTFIEDLCYKTQHSEYDLRYDTSGVLMSAPKLDPTEGFECEVVLSPPKGSAVVLSIYRYDLYSEDVLIIEDSDRHRVALMGYGVFKDEKKSVISEGKMRIFYKTGNKTAVHMRAGFQFTFTKVMKSPCSTNEYKCDNGYCVLKDYICDGHNHCGDNSDQKKCGYVDPTPASNNLEILDVGRQRAVLFLSLTIVGAIILLIVIIVFIVYVVRGAKLKKQIAKNQKSANSANAVPMQSVSSTVPRQAAHAPFTAVPHAQSTTVHHHAPSTTVHHHAPSSSAPVQGNSLYDRVRRSFRGARAPPGVEHIPKEQSRNEPYQVPSMYPSLDIEPNAPVMYGEENPDFRIEE